MSVVNVVSLKNGFNNIVDGYEKTLDTSSQVVKCFNKILSIIETAGAYFTFVPEVPGALQVGGKSVSRILSPLLLPFKLKSIFIRCFEAIKTNSITERIYLALDVIADSAFFTGKMSSLLQKMENLKWIKNAPVIPFMEYILIPFTVIKGALEGWDLIKKTKTFWVIQGGGTLATKKKALEELKKLHAHGLDDVKDQLGLSAQCRLSERVDSLMKGLRKKGPAGIKQVQEFYGMMRGRATLKLSLGVANMALTVTSFVGGVLALAIPHVPIAGGMITSVSSVVSFGLSATEALFVTDDILDKKRKCLALRIKDTLLETAQAAGQKIVALTQNLMPCAA